MPVLSTLGAATAKAWGFLQQVAAAADPYFNYVTMLLNGDGTNGAQNNTFLDSSSNAFSITRNGNTTQGSFSPYGSLWSNYFNGSSSYLTTNASVPATGTFTVEMWVYPTSSSGYQLLFSQYTSGNSGNFQMLWNDTASKFTLNIGGGVVLTSSSTYATNNWYHLAITRDGSNNMTMWVNGTSVATTTNSTSIVQLTTYIASRSALDGYFNGYISNVRVTNTAVYSASFTPSTTPLTAISGTSLLTCQSNRFIDNSSNAFALTVNGTPSVQRFSPFNPTTAYTTATIGGSGYFDGNLDFLSAPDNTAFNFGSGDMTIECWFYLNNSGTSSRATSAWGLFGKGTGSSLSIKMEGCTPNGWDVYVSTNGSSATQHIAFAGSTIKAFQWTHFAVVRSGGTIYVYVNGVSVGSAAISGSIYNDTSPFCVGASTTNTSYTYFDEWTGYISSFRVVKGTAVYPSGTTFTPPTTPLTSVSGTSLLCDFTNAGIPDYAMMNDLETVGNAQVSTSVKKFGTGSISFDNSSGTYLKTINGNAYISGTEDFTIEGWIYLNSTSATQTIISGTNNNSLFLRYGQGYGTTQGLNIGKQNVADCEYCAYTFSTNTWYYITVTRTAGAINFFVNGVKQTTQGSGASSYSFPVATQINVGYFGVEPFNGYMDDFRITKGYARYTSTFTPPSAALPLY